MKIVIEKVNDYLIVSIPTTQKESNIYKEEMGQELDRVPSLMGIITNEKGFKDYTINYSIDMSYCGKAPQTGSPILHLEEEDWKKVVKELGLSQIEYEECSKCHFCIMGSYTLSKSGKPVCYECSDDI